MKERNATRQLSGNRPAWLGVKHIVWFNWHFYLLAAILMILLAAGYIFSSGTLSTLVLIALLTLIIKILVSLLVSWYVYDLSGLYTFDWLKKWVSAPHTIVNIHAGFDESSALLQKCYPQSRLVVCDFYNPAKHTEPSIARARKVYAPFPGTLPVSTLDHALPVDGADAILLILAAHEIRDHAERASFFRALAHSLSPGGRIIVVEHLRNLPNFLAFSIGAFHFLSWTSWYNTFKAAGLQVISKKKINPFIHLIVISHASASA